MKKLVTIAIPIFKRLNYLPQVLRVVAAQDYPRIELIVSDNGLNGGKVPELVNEFYSKPYRFRQNAASVSLSTHFNQLVQEASGDYFILLADDDEISPNYVSELVPLLERNPRATVAISKQEIMNESGITVRESNERVPPILSGPALIRAAWHTYEYQFECFATLLARTQDIKKCGGYPDFCKGHSNDDALLVKLCLDGYAVFSPRCTFRYRLYESSHGLSISIEEVAAATKDFMQFLDSDPILQRFASAHPAEWRELKSILGEMNWEVFYNRWKGMYRRRLAPCQWIRAAFLLPFIPAYYLKAASTLAEVFQTALTSRAKQIFAQQIRPGN